MAISHYFGGKVIKLPGAYSDTKAIASARATVANSGKVIILDTGSNGGWGSGSGVSGELLEGSDSVYTFRNAREMQAFVKGGPWYNLATCLFTPSRVPETNGVSEVIWIGAKTTTAAKITLTFAAGNVEVLCKDEGTFSNGIEYENQSGEDVLIKGYCATKHLGVKDPAKFIFKFWVSTYTGEASDNLPYNEISKENSLPELVAQSPEVSTIAELCEWMQSDYSFGLGFQLKEAKTGAIVSGDITEGNILAAGGTETYNATDIDAALDSIKAKDGSFLISDMVGEDAQSATNTKLQYYCQSEARFKTILVVAAGSSRSELETVSIPAAEYFNSSLVCCVHGGVKRLSQLTSTRQRTWNSLTHACLVVGRLAGVQPQVPATFKEIDVIGLQSQLSEGELELCLDKGLLTSYYDEDMGRYNILKGVSSLQNNSRLVNPDGTTPSIQITRIVNQVNKEIVLDAKTELFTQRDGVNLLTLSAVFLRDWVIEKLKQKVQRGLIVEWADVEVTRQEDAFFVTYKMQPNSEINFLFNTGFLVGN